MSSAKQSTPTAKKKSPTKRRSLAPSASSPEIKLSYQAAGRDTLAVIDSELGRAPASPAEAPAIEISETAAGRETLAAIAEELTVSARPRQNTLPYADKIKNAPGARSPSRVPAPPKPRSEPEPTAVAAPPEPAEEITLKLPLRAVAPVSAPEAVEIFELLTFLVRGPNVGELSTDAARRRFVEEHLLRRVPGGSLDAVERIEATPWTTKGTLVLRVWCRT